jgi:hypothetical protein
VIPEVNRYRVLSAYVYWQDTGAASAGWCKFVWAGTESSVWTAAYTYRMSASQTHKFHMGTSERFLRLTTEKYDAKGWGIGGKLLGRRLELVAPMLEEAAAALDSSWPPVFGRQLSGPLWANWNPDSVPWERLAKIKSRKRSRSSMANSGEDTTVFRADCWCPEWCPETAE